MSPSYLENRGPGANHFKVIKRLVIDYGAGGGGLQNGKIMGPDFFATERLGNFLRLR